MRQRTSLASGFLPNPPSFSLLSSLFIFNMEDSITGGRMDAKERRKETDETPPENPAATR